MPVALDVAAFPADDEHYEILGVARVREPARRRRLDVHEPAFADLPALVADVEPGAPVMHEVQLVLRVVVVQEAFVARGHHDRVHPERGDAERAAHLAKAVTITELVERPERIAAHSLLTISSASSRVNARNVSVCSAP